MLKRKSSWRIVFFFLTAITTPCMANFSSPSEEHIEKLEKLHRQAENDIAQNNYAAAVHSYRDILLLEPDDEVAYTNLGMIYMILGDNPRAKDSFLNALHINPENALALQGLHRIQDPDRVILPEAAQPPPVPQPVIVDRTPDRERNIQRALKKAGFYHGPLDGKIGPQSRKAIQSFQTKHGLEPDGVVGPRTWKALEKYLES